MQRVMSNLVKNNYTIAKELIKTAKGKKKDNLYDAHARQQR